MAVFKYHTAKLKASKELVDMFVKVGNQFLTTYGTLQTVYEVEKITKTGRVRIIKKSDNNRPRFPDSKTLGITIRHGTPCFFIEKCPFLPEHIPYEEVCRKRGQYFDAIEREFKEYIRGRRYFVYELSISYVVTGYLPVSLNVKLENRVFLNNTILQFTSPDKPLQIAYTGGLFNQQTLRRDYSADITILLCCYKWGIPVEVARIVLNYFYKAEYEMFVH